MGLRANFRGEVQVKGDLNAQVDEPKTARVAGIARSASGLRDTLFQTIEDLRAGRIDAVEAKQVAALSAVIIKSVEVQIDFERLRLADEVPRHLSDMLLAPPLGETSK